jgi:hypothetical protein
MELRSQKKLTKLSSKEKEEIKRNRWRERDLY